MRINHSVVRRLVIAGAIAGLLSDAAAAPPTAIKASCHAKFDRAWQQQVVALDFIRMLQTGSLDDLGRYITPDASLFDINSGERAAVDSYLRAALMKLRSTRVEVTGALISGDTVALRLNTPEDSGSSLLLLHFAGGCLVSAASAR